MTSDSTPWPDIFARSCVWIATYRYMATDSTGESVLCVPVFSTIEAARLILDRLGLKKVEPFPILSIDGLVSFLGGCQIGSGYSHLCFEPETDHAFIQLIEDLRYES